MKNGATKEKRNPFRFASGGSCPQRKRLGNRFSLVPYSAEWRRRPRRRTLCSTASWPVSRDAEAASPLPLRTTSTIYPLFSLEAERIPLPPCRVSILPLRTSLASFAPTSATFALRFFRDIQRKQNLPCLPCIPWFQIVNPYHNSQPLSSKGGSDFSQTRSSVHSSASTTRPRAHYDQRRDNPQATGGQTIC